MSDDDSTGDKLIVAIMAAALAVIVTLIALATCDAPRADGKTWEDGGHTPAGIAIRAREMFLHLCETQFPNAHACTGMWYPNLLPATVVASPVYGTEASELCDGSGMTALTTLCDAYGGVEGSESSSPGIQQLLTWPPLGGATGTAPYFAWTRCATGPTSKRAHVYVACRVGGPGPEEGP